MPRATNFAKGDGPSFAAPLGSEPEGWGLPPGAQRFHFFNAWRRSLCNKFHQYGGLLQHRQTRRVPGNPELCRACLAQLAIIDAGKDGAQ